MRTRFLSLIVSFFLAAVVTHVAAQKAITDGTIVFSSTVQGQDMDFTQYFSPDSLATTYNAGPATIRILVDAHYASFVILVDAPAANIKKAAVMNPQEIQQAIQGFPVFSYSRTADSKQISGFNCTRIVATDTAAKKTYDVWVTNDVSVPAHAIPRYYAEIGGVPIEYTAFQKQGDGRLNSLDITVKSINDQKAPDGTFSIAPDYDRITLDDLKAMSNGQ